MLKQKALGSIVRIESTIAVDPSRCMRMRFNECSCSRCSEQCRSGAIAVGDGVRVKGDACTGCMRCVAACPSDCFAINGFDFYALVSRLGRIPHPVLGCSTRPDLPAHERTFCMGFLSEEHLIALAAFMKTPLQINLTGCSRCDNGFVAELLRERLRALAERTSPGMFDKLRLIDDASALDFREVSYDRRGFFRAMKDLTLLRAAGFFEHEAVEEGSKAYSAKHIPLKRELLNRAVSVLPAKDAQRVLRAHYYSVLITESCTDCFACVGMCPTGALKVSGNELGPALGFNSALCSGCGLCEQFCTDAALHVVRGVAGSSPFTSQLLKKLPADLKNAQHSDASRSRGAAGGGEPYA